MKRKHYPKYPATVSFLFGPAVFLQIKVAFSLTLDCSGRKLDSLH